jgi:hypothetical protein
MCGWVEEDLEEEEKEEESKSTLNSLRHISLSQILYYY